MNTRGTNSSTRHRASPHMLDCLLIFTASKFVAWEPWFAPTSGTGFKIHRSSAARRVISPRVPPFCGKQSHGVARGTGFEVSPKQGLDYVDVAVCLPMVVRFRILDLEIRFGMAMLCQHFCFEDEGGEGGGHEGPRGNPAARHAKSSPLICRPIGHTTSSFRR